MRVFEAKGSESKPRADMFLPNGLNGFGFFLDAVAVAFLVAAFVTQIWGLLIGFLISGLLGAAAYLCWKNQTIKIIDEDTFVYSTFLGKKTTYKFSDIKDLKVKGSSMVIKRGTKVKSIRLTDNPEEVDCKIEGSSIVLKTCFLKK